MSGKKSAIPSNNTTNQQDETVSLLNQLESQYNQHSYKFKHYRTSSRNQNPVEDLHVYLNGLLQGVKISIYSLQCTEKALQLENKKIPNKLLLLKIHLMILKARIYVSISYSKPEKKPKAVMTFFAIMLEFIKTSKTPYIKNSPYQKEIVYALRMISRYGDAKEFPHYNMVAWASTRCIIEKQYNDGFDKLDAYGSVVDFTQNIKLNTLTLRREFHGIFEAMDKDYGARFADNALNLLEKLDYLNAIALIYEATVKNHPTVTRNSLTNCTDKFVAILQQEYEHFIPKIDLVRRSLEIEEIMEDLDCLGVYHKFVSRFYKFQQSQLKDLLYVHKYLELANTPVLRNKIFDLIVSMRRLFIDFHAFNTVVDTRMQKALLSLSLFREVANDVDSKHFIIGNWLDENELTDFINAHTKSTEQSAKSLDIAMKTSKETMEALISESKKTPKIREKTQKPNITHKAKTSKQSVLEKKNPPTNKHKAPFNESLHQCEQGALMLADKNYEKALFHFDLSYKKALTSEDKLHALDGLIISIQQDTLSFLTQINTEYAFLDNNIHHTDTLISNGINNLIYLDTLYTQFKQVTAAFEKTRPQETLKDIVYGNAILRDDYLKIKEKVNQLYMIKDRRMAEKNRKNKTRTLELKKIIQPSDFPSLDPHSIKTTKTRQIKLPPELIEVFDFLNQVKGCHYLVGSMVLHLLQNGQGNAMQPSDLDYLSLHSQSEDWIKNGHFMQVTEERHLYKLTRWCSFQPPLPLEVWLDERDELHECLLSRDFTISALACSSEGIILDPTSLGFDDLQNKRLRMIGQPEIRFHESPSILLRVIKYIQLGFTPNQAIIDAMHAWQPTEETNKEKLHVLCEKIFFASSDKLTFAYHLRESQLLAKLFDFKEKATNEEVVTFLETKWMKSNAINKNSFFQKQESPTCGDVSCKKGDLDQFQKM